MKKVSVNDPRSSSKRVAALPRGIWARLKCCFQRNTLLTVGSFLKCRIEDHRTAFGNEWDSTQDPEPLRGHTKRLCMCWDLIRNFLIRESRPPCPIWHMPNSTKWTLSKASIASTQKPSELSTPWGFGASPQPSARHQEIPWQDFLNLS